MKRNVLAYLILLVCRFTLSAQQLPVDSFRALPAFEAKSNRFQQFNTGVKVVTIDSLTQQILKQQSLAQLLTLTTPVFVKAYGQGQLATSSFRGAGAEHTAILWNGINLQNSMNGQTDFNLLPAGFMNEVAVQFGGNTSLYGSGAIGGAILLNNQAGYDKKLTANYELSTGSYGFRQHWFGVAYGKKRHYLKAKAFINQAENNLKFYNSLAQGNPLQKLRNAESRANGIMLESGYKINSKQSLDIRYWYHFADRNIPPTIGMEMSLANQVDESNRLALEWKHIGNRSKTVVRSAMIKEMLHYQDPLSAISARSNSTALIGELDHSRNILTRVQLNVGLNYTRTSATNESYTGKALRNSIAGFSSLNIKLIPRWLVTLNVRQELTDGMRLPFTAGVGSSFQLLKWMQFTGHVNKSYRLPTFNDLYWITGNPELKPESGWAQELGLVMGFSKQKSKVTVKTNAFNRKVSDWIQWQPVGGSWRPNNVKEVWSRGVELDAKYHVSVGNVLLSWISDLSYVLSTNQKVYAQNDEVIGKQLIYIPRLTHRHWCQVTHKGYYMAAQMAYTGYRFTSSDNAVFIDDYTLMNAFMGYSYQFKPLRLDIKLQCNNITGVEYQVLPARPMPLRNYLLTIGITY